MNMVGGIHTGEASVGFIGSATRKKFGIVGFAVNETSRIQSLAQEGQVVVSESTRVALSQEIRLGPRFEVNLKGPKGSRTLYRIEDLPAEYEEGVQVPNLHLVSQLLDSQRLSLSRASRRVPMSSVSSSVLNYLPNAQRALGRSSSVSDALYAQSPQETRHRITAESAVAR